jgi:hypothetical protein
MPLGALKNFSIFRKLKLGQEENLFARRTHDGRKDFYSHRLGRLAVFIAPIKGIGQKFASFGSQIAPLIEKLTGFAIFSIKHVIPL